jgi:hypothetical protein
MNQDIEFDPHTRHIGLLFLLWWIDIRDDCEFDGIYLSIILILLIKGQEMRKRVPKSGLRMSFLDAILSVRRLEICSNSP